MEDRIYIYDEHHLPVCEITVDEREIRLTSQSIDRRMTRRVERFINDVRTVGVERRSSCDDGDAVIEKVERLKLGDAGFMDLLKDTINRSSFGGQRVFAALHRLESYDSTPIPNDTALGIGHEAVYVAVLKASEADRNSDLRLDIPMCRLPQGARYVKINGKNFFGYGIANTEWNLDRNRKIAPASDGMNRQALSA